MAWMCFLLPALHAYEAVTLIPPEGDFWTGERVDVVVELRAKGSFSGVPTFQLPELPGTQIVKMGRPVISSESSDEGELFVQRYQFAMFSQQSGDLQVPVVPVTFGVQAGSELKQISGEVPAFSVQLKRPPGIPEERFVVSSPKYSLEQSWSSDEEEFEVGGVLTRSLIQTAENLSGMALPPLPQAAPEGVRVYPPKVSITDQSPRGTFSGQREEALRYRFETAGRIEIPAVTFQWWNPESEKLEQKIIPGRTVKVKGPMLGARFRLHWGCIVTGIFLCGTFVFLFYKFRKTLISKIPRKQHLPKLNPFSP
ncbi:hypothetical protein P0Y35_11060 [Kiritimatiellaeota bacterium B1221]|nr:hypothetical protein [Kiritimatiellaeota bacterium B1221]